MKKSISIILISFFVLSSFGQLDSDCFFDVKKKHIAEIERLDLGKKWTQNLDTLNKDLTPADWDSIAAVGKRTLINITNCKFPILFLRTSENKEINTNAIKSEFILVNFNYYYCDPCLKQLEDLSQIKNEMKNKVTVLVFFPEAQKDVQQIIDKYKSLLDFFPDMRKFIEEHNLGLGTPLNLILDKNKKVIYATTGANHNLGLLYKELIPYLK